MDVTVAGLRVLRETAERGTFTAAAAALGYTQSAVSRQVAALERAVGVRVFERRPEGPVLTASGRMLLGHARTVLDELDVAARELRDGRSGGRVRLGGFASAGVVLLPRTLRTLRRERPDLQVSTRIATTPALVRGLRAGTLDLAVLSSQPPHRPPDAESPALVVHPLAEHRLRVAVPADGPLGGLGELTLADLVDQPWVVTPSRADEPQLGSWPSLPARPRIVHTAADWAAKLALVASGCAITTVPPLIEPAVPADVRVLSVVDGPVETRRIVAAHRPGPADGPVRAVLDVLATHAGDLTGPDGA